jgi:glucose dehydrogenase
MKSKDVKKFSVEFIDDDGTKSIWKYDLNITTNGPISTEQIFPKEYQIVNPTDESIPVSKRLFLNEATGKLVAYTRAKQLGII